MERQPPERLRGRISPLRLLIAAQLAAVAVVGVGTVLDFRIWAHVDERAHYAYVQEVAEQGRLPLLSDTIGDEVQSIEEGVWPEPPSADPAELGFAGEIYEAFQPPLYYLVAAPVFLAVPDHLDKVYALRGLNLLFLLGAIAIVALIARELAGRHWEPAFAASLAVFLWPGLVVRAITVSNAGLELLLVLAVIHQLVVARSRRSPGHLAAAGGLLGLAALTKLTVVYMAPMLGAGIVLCLRARPDARMRAAAAAAVVLPALLLAPWVASNLDRYGAPTPNQAAREQQTPYFEGKFGAVEQPGPPAGNRDLVRTAVTPQEWGVWWAQGWRGAAQEVLGWAFFAAFGVAIAVAAARRWWRALLWLGIPLLLALAMVNLTHLLADWWIYFARYLYPTLPGAAMLAGLALARTKGGAWTGATAATASAALALVWFDGTILH